MRIRSVAVCIALAAVSLVALQVKVTSQHARARDPGVRTGEPSAGAPLPGLTAEELE